MCQALCLDFDTLLFKSHNKGAGCCPVLHWNPRRPGPMPHGWETRGQETNPGLLTSTGCMFHGRSFCPFPTSPDHVARGRRGSRSIASAWCRLYAFVPLTWPWGWRPGQEVGWGDNAPFWAAFNFMPLVFRSLICIS